MTFRRWLYLQVQSQDYLVLPYVGQAVTEVVSLRGGDSVCKVAKLGELGGKDMEEGLSHVRPQKVHWRKSCDIIKLTSTFRMSLKILDEYFHLPGFAVPVVRHTEPE